MKVIEWIEEEIKGKRGYVRGYAEKIGEHQASIEEWKELVKGLNEEIKELEGAKRKLE